MARWFPSGLATRHKWNELGEDFESSSLTGPRFRAHQRHLSALLRELGSPFVDPTEVFEAREREGQRLYLAYDGHLNAEGYALLAELLLREFERRS